MAALLTRYPDIELDISLVDRVVDLVEEGYDLAVRISRGGSPALVSRKLATTRHLICASPDYVARHGAPESPEDLKDHACIAYTYSDSADEWRLLDDAGKEHSVAVRQHHADQQWRYRPRSGAGRPWHHPAADLPDRRGFAAEAGWCPC